MKIVDSHCHLNFPEFRNDLDLVIENAAKNNVTTMQTICTELSEFPEVESIANKYPNIFCSVGVHPHEVDKEGIPDINKLFEYARRPKVIGIGETGLDYYYKHSDIISQKKSFIEHIKVSRELNMPIIIHTRDADEDMIEILQTEMAKGKFPALIHCFTSTKTLADIVLGLGMYISISGIVTFKNALNLQEIVRNIPLDRMLVETDSPFLAPAPFRGKRNEPAYTKNTVEFIAHLKNVTPKVIAQYTTENFFKLFTKANAI